jgi:adenosylmethionine---8-amino-7-oxononanoate aminotransferase
MTNNTPVWHPFTQHGIEPQMPLVTRTDGAYLYTADGNKILDAISSWWVITHGHRYPKIIDAIIEATQSLDQVIFAGFTHQPAEDLATALVEMAPKGLTRVFYSDSGSTAVEVALKMALGHFKHLGEARSRLIVMEHSYHGDTIGTMSVGERGVFNSPYTPLLFDVDTIPFPHRGKEQATLDALEALTKSGQVAALIVEPLVLGAGGMLMYPAWVLAEMRRITTQSGTLLIADEVMTGWGRTGTMFACEQASITPDILCTSKGITGGLLPLAATLASEAVYQSHYSTDRARTFFHSSSYTANPIACAAALANVKIWRDEPVMARITALGAEHNSQLKRFETNTHFENIRTCGTIAALDLRVSATGYLADVGPKMRAFFMSRGILIRPLGNVLYLLPPYCVTPDELTLIYDTIEEAGQIFGNADA